MNGAAASALKIETGGLETDDMGKTSMFGGLNSALLPARPEGARLACVPPDNNAIDPAGSTFSNKGSSVCQSPSPTNKADRLSNLQDKISAA